MAQTQSGCRDGDLLHQGLLLVRHLGPVALNSRPGHVQLTKKYKVREIGEPEILHTIEDLTRRSDEKAKHAA